MAGQFVLHCPPAHSQARIPNPEFRGLEDDMTARLNMGQAAPETYKAMRTLSSYSRQAGLEPSLIELIDIRASQINGCAFCLHMHTRDARAHGETEERIYLLEAWREAPVYTERERAALEWTEALTTLDGRGVPDAVYDAVKRHFSDDEMVKLSLAIAVINSWNRLMIGFQVPPQIEAGTRK
jgi:AhpD family alkylhydroperoxidase